MKQERFIDKTSLDRERSRLNALSNVFTKTNRILTGNRAITVAIREPGRHVPPKVPAYSNGRDITINVNLIKELGSKATLMTLQGLNYHELCHILYTPQQGDRFGLRNWVNVGGYANTFNILEDQRIETLFVAKYRPARHYFVQMVLDHIMQDKEQWKRAHVLVHGRRYLPKNIRDEFAARWMDQKTVKDISRVIDEYRLLNLTVLSDSNKSRILIERLHRLLGSLSAADQAKLAEENGCQIKEISQYGNPSTEPDAKQSKEAAEQAKKDTAEQDKKEEGGEDGSEFWDEADEENDEDGGDGIEGESDSPEEEDELDTDDSDGDSAGDGEDDDSEDDGDNSGNQGMGGDDDAGDSEDGEDDDENGGGTDSEGVGSDVDDVDTDDKPGVSSQGTGLTEAQLSDELEEVLNAVSDNEQINEDVRQLGEAMNDPHNFDLDARNSETEQVDIPTHIKEAAERVGQEFRVLYAEMEPGWRYGSDQGRLNVGRAIASDEWDEDIFDEWDEGRQESSGLEMVIALDVSGSMLHYDDYREMRPDHSGGTPIEAACFAVWVMKRACEELGATVSVVGFGSGASTIIPRHDKARLDKATYVTKLQGSTQPAEAFAIARWVLSNSEMPNKLFVVVTDGAWAGSFGPEASRYISGDTNQYQNNNIQINRLLGEIEATKVYMGIGSPCEPVYQSQFNVSRVISNVEEIVPIVQQAIKQMLK